MDWNAVNYYTSNGICLFCGEKAKEQHHRYAHDAFDDDIFVSWDCQCPSRVAWYKSIDKTNDYVKKAKYRQSILQTEEHITELKKKLETIPAEVLRLEKTAETLRKELEE